MACRAWRKSPSLSALSSKGRVLGTNLNALSCSPQTLRLSLSRWAASGCGVPRDDALLRYAPQGHFLRCSSGSASIGRWSTYPCWYHPQSQHKLKG